MTFVSRNTTTQKLSCQREKGTDGESQGRRQQRATPPNFAWVPSITRHLIHCAFSTPSPLSSKQPALFSTPKSHVSSRKRDKRTHAHGRPTPRHPWAAKSKITSKPCFTFHTRRVYCSRLPLLETGRLLNYNPKHGRSLAELW